ncbi:MAG: DUF1592 domain-containing protein [Planctomycetaceae bacterium]
MSVLRFALFSAVTFLSGSPSLPAEDADVATVIAPFLKTHCLDCHNTETAEAKLNLETTRSAADIVDRHQVWQEIIHRLQADEMPPADYSPRPSEQQVGEIVRQIREILMSEAKRNAGDPGEVPVRRLSNAEYNYTIRDLTGVDIQPTREFPVDPANEAGFDNSAESLTLSPALFNKYLSGAREVVQHLVLKPDGFDFAPHPVMTDTDRDKYCVNRIVDFYRQQPTDLATYFLAARQLQVHPGKSVRSVDAVAAEFGISAKYLSTLTRLLIDSQDDYGPLEIVRRMWREIPDNADESTAMEACRRMAEFVATVRRRLEPPVEGLDVRGIHRGAQAFVLWKNDQYAANRRRFNSAATIDAPDVAPTTLEEQSLVLPVDGEERRQYWRALARFADIFPDAFYISERGRDYVGVPREKQEKGRLLSAGFHSMMGYYRDDAPLCDLILTEDQKSELDRLWRELDFIAYAPVRQYQGFLWFERTDSQWMRDEVFDFARPENLNALEENQIEKLSEVYLDKARRNGAEGVSEQAIVDYFRNMNGAIRWVEQAHLAAEASHLVQLEVFAAKCYRRPLADTEKHELKTFYQSLRSKDGLTHEEAIQDTIVSLLVSPLFFYRTDLAARTNDSGPSLTINRHALDRFQLASRLSYFLWSSMPDEELLNLAASGHLQDHDQLKSQVRRMLQDERSRSLAIEFAGNWLGFRRFEEHNSVDRNRFPQFTDALRAAMFEEPVRFIHSIIQNDSPLLDCLYADYTFVNEPLARHYGLEYPSSPPESTDDGWIRIEQAAQKQRGGLVPMSVFLTQNSPGLRTSPVKRGYWVVRKLLGEHIPAPPPNVPDLPEDESALGDLTLAAALAKHRDHAACAGCHDRFDSVGLVFENYGPIGELRSIDLGGRPIESSAVFPDGSEGSQLVDLQRYLKQNRESDFIDAFCRKLLTFGLGRSLLLSDDLLLDEMKAKLHTDGYRFRSLIETIVTSEQFLMRR